MSVPLTTFLSDRVPQAVRVDSVSHSVCQYVLITRGTDSSFPGTSFPFSTTWCGPVQVFSAPGLGGGLTEGLRIEQEMRGRRWTVDYSKGCRKFCFMYEKPDRLFREVS